jgi:hypothetical protein
MQYLKKPQLGTAVFKQATDENYVFERRHLYTKNWLCYFKKKKETSVSLLLFYFIFKCAILKRKNRRSGIGLVYIEL